MRIALLLILWAYFFVARWIVLPYIPFPTDDVAFEESLHGLPERYYPFPLAPYLWRFTAFAIRCITPAADEFGYDLLAQAQIALLCVTAWLVYLTAERLTDRRHAILAAALVLTSLWSFQYVLVVSHAVPTALCFAFAMYAATMYRQTVSSLWAVLLVMSMAALMLVSSSGVFWAAAAGVWVTAQLAVHRVAPRISPLAALPILVVLLALWEYRIYMEPLLMQQYLENLRSNWYSVSSEMFGDEGFSTIRLATGFNIAYLAPAVAGLSIFAAALARSRSVLALAATLVLVYAAAEIQPHTKLARTFYPFLVLFVFLLVAGLHAMPRRTLVQRATTLVLYAAIVGVVAIDAVRSRSAYEDRFALYRALHPHAATATIWHTADDHHARVIARALGLSYGKPLATGILGTGVPAPGDIILIGPRGPMNGRSVMRACLLPHVAPVGIAASGERFPYPGYWPAFQLENELCQNLMIWGRSPDGDDPQNMMTVRRATSPASADLGSHGYGKRE